MELAILGASQTNQTFCRLRLVAFVLSVVICVASLATAVALLASLDVREIVIAELKGGLSDTPFLNWIPAQQILGKQAERFLWVLVPMIIGFSVEGIALGWRNSSLRRMFFVASISDKYDAAYYAIRILSLGPFVILILTLGLSYFWDFLVAEVRRFIFLRHLRIQTGVGIIDMFNYYMAVSFFSYRAHRLLHWGPFWQLHRMHHSATTLSPLTTQRAHPAALFVGRLFYAWPPILFGAPSDFLFIYSAVMITHEYVVHSNLASDWGWVGRWILNSPAGHRAHHSPLLEYQNKNFGIFMIWDRIFGTYVPGVPVTAPVGIAEQVHNTGNLPREWLLDSWGFARGCWPEVATRQKNARVGLSAGEPMPPLLLAIMGGPTRVGRLWKRFEVR